MRSFLGLTWAFYEHNNYCSKNTIIRILSVIYSHKQRSLTRQNTHRTVTTKSQLATWPLFTSNNTIIISCHSQLINKNIKLLCHASCTWVTVIMLYIHRQCTVALMHCTVHKYEHHTNQNEAKMNKKGSKDGLRINACGHYALMEKQ